MRLWWDGAILWCRENVSRNCPVSDTRSHKMLAVSSISSTGSSSSSSSSPNRVVVVAVVLAAVAVVLAVPTELLW